MKSFKDIFAWAPDVEERKIHLDAGEGWYLYSYENRLLVAHGCDGASGGMIFESVDDFNLCSYCRIKPPLALNVAGQLLDWGKEL